MAIQLEQLSFAAQVPEPAFDTMQRASPFDITIASWTSNTGINSDQLSAGSLDSYIGNFLQLLDGNVSGEWTRIRTYDGSNDATVDPVSNASPTATRARMWTPPEPIVNATSNGSTTTTVSTSRTEANDYWNDPDRMYLVWEGGGGAGSLVRGEVSQITDFVAATDTFTHGAVTSTTTGDLAVIRQPIKFTELTLDPQYTFIKRKFIKGTMQKDPGVHGPKMGSLNAKLEIQGLATSASGATLAEPPIEAGDFLTSAFTQDLDGSSLNTGGGDSDTLNITTATQERFAVGNIVLMNGEAAGIVAITDGGVGDDVLEIRPAFPQGTGVGGVVVYGGANYKPKTASFRSHTIEHYAGGAISGAVRQLFYGWHFDVELEGFQADSLPFLRLSGPFDTHIRQEVAAPYTPTFATKLPWPTKSARVNLGGTEFLTIKGASFKTGYVWTPQESINGANRTNGHIMSDRDSTGTLQIWMENNNHLETFEIGTEQTLLIQIGSVTTNCFALFVPNIQYTDVKIGAEGGGYMVDITYDVLRPNISGATNASLSDFTMAWL